MGSILYRSTKHTGLLALNDSLGKMLNLDHVKNAVYVYPYTYYDANFVWGLYVGVRACGVGVGLCGVCLCVLLLSLCF